MLDGLQGLQGKLDVANSELTAAQEKRDLETPPLQEKLATSVHEQSSIYQNHNNKHDPTGTDYAYWNGKYAEAAAESARLQGEIDVLKAAVTAAIAAKDQIALDRQQRAREVIGFLSQSPTTEKCAAELSEDSDLESIKSCGGLDFDGKKRRESLSDDAVAIDPYFGGADPSVVIDDADKEAAARKQAKIAELIRISSATHSTKPIVVIPPPPGATPPEYSLSERLMNLLRNIAKP